MSRIITKMNLLVFLSLFIFVSACSQDPSTWKINLNDDSIIFDNCIVKCKVNLIDSTTLDYYYILKISPLNYSSENLNLFSKKGEEFIKERVNKIEVGKSYVFKLDPLWEIIVKRNGHDSVSLTPASMRYIEFNGELFMTADFRIHPYITNNLKGLYYIPFK